MSASRGTMTCDRCGAPNRRVLVRVKVSRQSAGVMGGRVVAHEEWCAGCVASDIPIGMFADGPGDGG